MTRLPPKDKPTLLPCPFCGSAATLHCGNTNAWVNCDRLGCDCEQTHDSREQAIAAWNTRTAMNAARTPITSGGGGDADKDVKFLRSYFTGCQNKTWVGRVESIVARLTAKPSTEAEIEAAMLAVNPNVSDATAAYTRAVCRKLSTAKLNSEALVEALEACEVYFTELEEGGNEKHPGMLKIIRAGLAGAQT